MFLPSTSQRAAALALIACATTACGGGGGNPQPQNQTPTASFTTSAVSGTAPLSVSFDASASADPDGTIAQFAWDFNGDGTVDQTLAQATTQFTYSAAGNFTARLRVTDDDGAAAQTTQTITVTAPNPANQAPSAGFRAGVPAGGAPLQVKFFNESTDPDGTLVNFEWDFDGDGTFDQSGAEPDGLFTYQQPGTFQVQLRVTDNGGLTAAVSSDLLIPTATFVDEVLDANGADEPTSFGGLAVGGNPAVFFTSQGQLLYFRANDAAGTDWGAGVVVAPEAAAFTSGAIVGGNPAILYHEPSGGVVKYVRATDPLGAAWGESEFLNIASIEDDGPVTLLLVAGRPAALYAVGQSGNPTGVTYLRASDELGATWDLAQSVNASPAGLSAQDMDGLLVDGRPAYVFVTDTGDLQYLRSEDDLGADWPDTPLALAPGISVGRPSAAIIAGKPAVATTDTNNLLFIQAQDATGTTWEAPQTVVTETGTMSGASLASAGGRTVIAFRVNDTDALELVVAADNDGDSFQGRSVIEAANALGHFALPLGGAPGVVYNLDSVGVKFSGAQ